MDLRQLNAMVAVVDHGGFSAAARALHTVQSNVSTHVARLEEELGTALIDRSTNQPTEAGAAVLERARHIQAELEALEADVTSLHDRIAGQVRLGIIGSTGRWLVPLLVNEVAEQYPGVEVLVIDATSTSLVPQVREGRLDLAVINLPLDDPDLVGEALFDEDRVLIAPAEHPLAQHQEVSLADLADHPLLLEPRGTAFRDEIDRRAEEEGVTLVAQAEIDGIRLLASLAYEGFGAAILPVTAIPRIGGRWRVVPVRDLPQRAVGLISRRRTQPPAPVRAVRTVLMDLVVEHAGEHPGIHPRTAQ